MRPSAQRLCEVVSASSIKQWRERTTSVDVFVLLLFKRCPIHTVIIPHQLIMIRLSGFSEIAITPSLICFFHQCRELDWIMRNHCSVTVCDSL